MAKNVPTMRWCSSPIVRPEPVFEALLLSVVLSSRYKLSSGKACRSSQKFFSMYCGLAMRDAILFTMVQLVRSLSMAASRIAFAPSRGKPSMASKYCHSCHASAAAVAAADLIGRDACLTHLSQQSHMNARHEVERHNVGHDASFAHLVEERLNV